MNNNLIVLVKRWFDKVNGNTYHSVQFESNGKYYHSGRTYGYERQYEETFKDLFMEEIKKKGKNDEDTEWWTDIHKIILNSLKDTQYIVIDNCKKKELDEIHKYK